MDDLPDNADTTAAHTPAVSAPPLPPEKVADRPLIGATAFPVLGSKAPDAIRLGRFYHGELSSILGRMSYGGERHAIIFGPNGSGKGTRLLVPNLLQSSGRSIFVIDPKGELAAITAPYRRTLGPVVIINPFGVLTDVPGYEDLKSAGFNPLARLDPHAPGFNAKASLLADALVISDGKERHWSDSARALLAALIMFTVMEARQALSPEALAMAGPDVGFAGEPQTPTMARVRELLCLASEEPAARNEYRGAGIPALALAMMKTSIAGLRNKAAQFTDWNREIQGIASTAKIQTEAFDDDEIAADLAKDGIDFHQLKERPTTVYLILPPEMMDRQAKWLRLLVTSALQSAMRYRKKGEPRILFMLDEFAGLGHMQIIETLWAQVRGYGIQILPVFQDLTQLQDIYGKRWETFIGMAGAVVSFAPNDLTTAEWLSERAGETTRTVKSQSFNVTKSKGGSSNFGHGLSWGSNDSTSESSSFNDNPTKVRLLHRHSLFGLREGATLTFLAGLSDVVPGYAPPYWDIIECAERARDNPFFASLAD
jgi:type IV secretion system protein VirD4